MFAVGLRGTKRGAMRAMASMGCEGAMRAAMASGMSPHSPKVNRRKG
jgi:hypothetical protein